VEHRVPAGERGVHRGRVEQVSHQVLGSVVAPLLAHVDDEHFVASLD